MNQLFNMVKNLIKRGWHSVSDRLQALEPRLRRLILLLLICVIFSLLFNLVYKPQRTVLMRLRQELLTLKNRELEIKSRIPNMEGENRLLVQLEKAFETVKEELATLESQLPPQSSLPQLLKEIVQQSSGYTLDFSSIKPISDKEQSAYPRLDMEMKFGTRYSEFVNYLYRLEEISPFISAQKIIIEENKESTVLDLYATIVLSTLLGEDGLEGFAASDLAKVTAMTPLAFERNPFLSRLKPQDEIKQKGEYKLSGIISRGAQSTAIINDEVYRIGDRIGTTQVKEILPDIVVLKENQEDIILRLDRD